MSHEPIENRGSTARDHLANERTFLAWFRTALGLVGLGVVLEGFAIDTQDAAWAKLGGAFVIAFGAAVLAYALHRYLHVTRRLEQNNYPVARRGPFAVSLTAGLLVIAALVYVLR